MKKLSVFLMFLLVFIVSACGALQDNAQLNWEAAQVYELKGDLEKKYFEVVSIVNEVQAQSIEKGDPVFSEGEMVTLQRVNEDVADVLEFMQGITDADGILENSDDLLLMVQIIEDTYQDAKDVVKAHESAFTERQRVTMEVFDERASEDWARITRLLENPTEENLKEILFLANDMVGTSLSLLKYLAMFV